MEQLQMITYWKYSEWIVVIQYEYFQHFIYIFLNIYSAEITVLRYGNKW